MSSFCLFLKQHLATIINMYIFWLSIYLCIFLVYTIFFSFFNTVNGIGLSFLGPLWAPLLPSFINILVTSQGTSSSFLTCKNQGKESTRMEFIFMVTGFPLDIGNLLFFFLSLIWGMDIQKMFETIC